MTVADLFVKIGLQGAQGVMKGLSGIGKSLEGVASTSLATKAAIAGVIVGMERLTGWASQAGADIKNFGVVTGESTKELQNWMHIGDRYNVTGDEMISTIKGIKNAMTQMDLTGAMPEGFGTFADTVGFDDTQKNNVFYVMNKLEEFAKKVKPGAANVLLKSMGVGDKMHQMFVVMDKDKDKISKTDIITDPELEKLEAINKMWKDFWFKLKTMGIKLVAKEGAWAVKELTYALRGLLGAGDYVLKLIDKFTILKLIVMAIAAYFFPITAAVLGLLYLLAEIQKYKEGKKGLITDIKGDSEDRVSKKIQKGSGIWDIVKNSPGDVAKASLGQYAKIANTVGGWFGVGEPDKKGKSNIVPDLKAPNGGAGNAGTGPSIVQNNTFTGIEGAEDLRSTFKDEMKNTMQQFGIGWN
jgi:hypothetical protein